MLHSVLFHYFLLLVFFSIGEGLSLRGEGGKDSDETARVVL